MDLLHEVDNIQDNQKLQRENLEEARPNGLSSLRRTTTASYRSVLSVRGLNDDSTLSLVPAIYEGYIDLSLFISPETLLYALLEAQTTSTTFARKGDVPDRIAYFLRRPNISFVEGFDASSIWTLEEAIAKDLLATHYAKFAKEDENMDDDA